jgi:hypothetical protein
MQNELEDFQLLIADLHATTIDGVVSRLDAAGFWDAEFLHDATQHAKKHKGRSLLRQVKDISGYRAWDSLLVAGQDGQPKRLYKQEVLFDVEDYRQTIDYATTKATYWMGEATRWRDAMGKRYGEQLVLTWDERAG